MQLSPIHSSLMRSLVLTSGVSRPALYFSAVKSAPLPEVDAENLKKDVVELCKLVRNPEHMDQLNQAADLIRKEWEKLGLTVTEQPFNVGDKTFKNLVVSFGPKDGERFIVGAHYDVCGNQPGADDNASGIAGVLEISRMLAKQKPDLKKRLDLIAYTLEEPPYSCLGSLKHAEKMKAEKVPIKGMISLEMLGYYKDEPKSQQFPSKIMSWFYPSAGNFIAVVGYGKSFSLIRKLAKTIRKHTPMPVSKLYSPINRFGLDRSDHCRYADMGIPAVMVTDTANFRTPHYHQKTDTPDTLDYTRMKHVVSGVYRFLLDTLS